MEKICYVLVGYFDVVSTAISESHNQATPGQDMKNSLIKRLRKSNKSRPGICGHNSRYRCGFCRVHDQAVWSGH